MDDHLAKPIQIPTLVAALSHWLAAETPLALAG
jgi:CheY-like chemotaxis protein